MSLEGIEQGRISEIYNILAQNPGVLRDAFLGMVIGKGSSPRVAETLEVDTSHLNDLGLMKGGEMPADVKRVVSAFVAVEDELGDNSIVWQLKPLEL